MTLFITTPVPYFNFMAIIVSTAVLLWFARALKRFARIIAVRSAAIDDSIVHVRGVGHTLIVFEGAPRRHLEAIIHTRPTMPPSQMNVLYHPYIIRNAEIKAMVNREGYYVDLHIWVASQTLVLVLSNIKVNLFKETFKSARDTAQLVMNTIKRNPEDSRYIRQNEFTEFLSRNGVVTHVSQPVSLAPGSHSVQVPFHPPGRRG